MLDLGARSGTVLGVLGMGVLGMGVLGLGVLSLDVLGLDVLGLDVLCWVWVLGLGTVLSTISG